MTTSLAFRVLLSHFLPGFLALPGVLALTALLLSLSGAQSCTSFTCCPEICTAQVLAWARYNAALASLGALVVPLILGVFLDDWRHGFWPCHEDKDKRWEKAFARLAGLPTHLFRFMYDEYYYYIEFDGNSFLAIGFSGLFVFVNYLRVNAWGASTGAFLLLLGPALLCWFFWRSWNGSLREFFEDVEGAARHHPGGASMPGPSCEGDRVR